MDAAIGAIGYERAASSVERDRERFPCVGQTSRRRRGPMGTQHKAAQCEHAQTVITRVANEKVAAADAEAVRAEKLTWSGAQTTETRHDLKLTRARIEALQLRGLLVEQKDAAIRSQGHVRGQGQAAEAAAGFTEGTSAAGQERQRQRLIRRANLD